MCKVKDTRLFKKIIYLFILFSCAWFFVFYCSVWGYIVAFIRVLISNVSYMNLLTHQVEYQLSGPYQQKMKGWLTKKKNESWKSYIESLR
jgi:hypothetical protein